MKNDDHIGSVWRTTTGREYTNIGDGFYEPCEPNKKGQYVYIQPTEYQVKKWVRIV